MNTISISPQRLDDILSQFKNRTVMVVGDVMIDEYQWGDVTRISPEAPVPVVQVERVSTCLGGAANVVQNLQTLGIKPVIISLSGTDENAARLRSMLSDLGVSAEGIVQSPQRPTTIKTRVMARQQQIVRTDRESVEDITDEEFIELRDKFHALFPSVQGVIISDYGKGVVSEPLLSEIISTCRQNNVFVSVDPKERHFKNYSGVHVITPNLKEAHNVLGMTVAHRSDDEVESMGWKIVNELNLHYLLITLSERGMALFDSKERTCTRLPTQARHVYDVTGAGDTVISVFTAAIVSGATPIEAAFIGNHAAGITVGEIGTASVTQQQLAVACKAS